ncbi:Alpha/beta hydrolase [Brazilian cedratvirus IHUMI]|uniref:Alpha/beta hydrolase n=1 Tax=Brazilian cedratvirus IHUMI TaxID=2126980 RepID=A0A2R8FDA5_9VIRU|nr:Alpha/beta hydrolase [Brazilian cedratvirus IHUMI]
MRLLCTLLLLSLALCFACSHKVEERCVKVDARGPLVPKTSLWIRTQGKVKHAHDKVIVLIHGTSGSNEYMRCVQERLSKDYFTIAFDLRGHGLSDQTPSNLLNYTHQVFADDVHAVLEKLGYTRNLVWVGVSIGGSIGLSYINTYPGEITNFVALSAGPGLYRLSGNVSWPYPIPVGGTPETLLPEACSSQLTLAKEKIAQNQARAGPIIGANVIPNAWTEDLRPLLDKVKVPSLLGYGSIDPLQPNGGSSKYLHEKISNSVLVKFEGAGHLMTITKPDAVATAIKKFLEEDLSAQELISLDRGCLVCSEVRVGPSRPSCSA